MGVGGCMPVYVGAYVCVCVYRCMLPDVYRNDETLSKNALKLASVDLSCCQLRTRAAAYIV